MEISIFKKNELFILEPAENTITETSPALWAPCDRAAAGELKKFLEHKAHEFACDHLAEIIAMTEMIRTRILEEFN